MSYQTEGTQSNLGRITAKPSLACLGKSSRQTTKNPVERDRRMHSGAGLSLSNWRKGNTPTISIHLRCLQPMA